MEPFNIHTMCVKKRKVRLTKATTHLFYPEYSTDSFLR